MNGEKEHRVEPKDIIDTFGKGLRILEAFDESHPRLTPSEAALRADVTRTAARRYLWSLVHFGYADTDGKNFWLTPRVLRVGHSYLAGSLLPRLIQPFMQRISRQTGETVNLSALDGHEVVYLARSAPPQVVVSVGFQVGTRVSAHLVTAGVAILSTWKPEALEAWLARHDFASFTPHTVVDPNVFRQRVQAARELGHWLSERQLFPTLNGVAVPLKDRKGECRGALGMTFQAGSRSAADVDNHLVPALRDVAAELQMIL
jgi:IclR family transcriptional regulator, pca regulon regulatory protein